MCWGELPRHPGRAHAWPLCGPWPRPHLAAAKLVDLRSSVNLVTMPHQPLDRPVGPPTYPGWRVAAPAARAKGQETPTQADLGSPRSEAGRCDRHWLRSHGSLSQWHDLRVAFTNGSIARLAQPQMARRSFRVGIIALTSVRLGAITFSRERPRIPSVARSRRSKALRWASSCHSVLT
jgi:hypothetical protein